MGRTLDIQEARQLFKDAIANSGYVPDSAEITTRTDPELGNAALFHCHWPLVEKGPYFGNFSRLITVKIASRAMNGFRSAEPRERGRVLDRFLSFFKRQLDVLQYNEQDPPNPPLVIIIDEHDFDM